MVRHNKLTEKEMSAVKCLRSLKEQPTQENIDEWLLLEIPKTTKK